MKNEPTRKNATPITGVGAFEIAAVAVQLAALKGEPEPDLVGAVTLLIEAHNEALKIQEFNDGLRWTGTMFHTLAPSRKDGPDEVSRQKSFAGAELITEPKFPGGGIELLKVLKIISGEDDKDRCFSYRDRFARYAYKRMFPTQRTSIKKARKSSELKHFFNETTRIEWPLDFWLMARNLAPFCPRFKEFYPNTAVVRNQRRDPKGKFVPTKPARGPTGKIKKRKKRVEVLATVEPARFSP